MNVCPVIKELKFDKDSKEGIQSLRRVIKLSKVLAITESVGILYSIFSDKKPLQVAYNIKNTEWNTFFESITSINPIVKRRVQQIINLQILAHDGEPFGNSEYPKFKQKLFWETMDDGFNRNCKINKKQKVAFKQ